MERWWWGRSVWYLFQSWMEGGGVSCCFLVYFFLFWLGKGDASGWETIYLEPWHPLCAAAWDMGV